MTEKKRKEEYDRILLILKNLFYGKNEETPFTTVKEYIDEFELEWDEDVLKTGERKSRRWWDEVENVLVINDDLGISFWTAETNRGESVEELGWDFDEKSVCLVKPVEITTIEWIPINNND